AVAELAAPGDAMKMETPSPREAPELRFDTCFVRGKGTFLTERASRPAQVVVENSLVALAGSFVSVDGSAKDPPGAAPLKLTLNRVTAYLTGHLALLRPRRNVSELLPFEWNVTNCLFASGAGKALIHVDGEVSDEGEQVRKLLKWDGKGKTN